MNNDNETLVFCFLFEKLTSLTILSFNYQLIQCKSESTSKNLEEKNLLKNWMSKGKEKGKILANVKYECS